ncbi:MAG: type II toxin-antitoxin system VapC family toxin, partial [Chloroflexi bacterium]
MKKMMLDTSAYAAFRKGHSEAIAQIQRAHSIMIPATVYGELLGGFEWGTRRDKNLTELNSFMQSLRVKAIPINLDTAQRYAVIYAFLRASGNPIPTNDLWIAASAMEHSATLLTLDKHF